MAEAKKTTKPSRKAAQSATADKATAETKTAVKKPAVKKVIKPVKTEEITKITPEVVVEEKTSKVAKAGKHSVKALKEAEAKAIKEERKAHKEEIGEAEQVAAKPKVVKVLMMFFSLVPC